MTDNIVWSEDDARDYIRKHASKWNLEHECFSCFDSDVEAARRRGEIPDYSRLANDALYEWDI
jgi:hypothetical protein